MAFVPSLLQQNLVDALVIHHEPVLQVRALLLANRHVLSETSLLLLLVLEYPPLHDLNQHTESLDVHAPLLP